MIYANTKLEVTHDTGLEDRRGDARTEQNARMRRDKIVNVQFVISASTNTSNFCRENVVGEGKTLQSSIYLCKYPVIMNSFVKNWKCQRSCG